MSAKSIFCDTHAPFIALEPSADSIHVSCRRTLLCRSLRCTFSSSSLSSSPLLSLSSPPPPPPSPFSTAPSSSPLSSPPSSSLSSSPPPSSSLPSSSLASSSSSSSSPPPPSSSSSSSPPSLLSSPSSSSSSSSSPLLSSTSSSPPPPSSPSPPSSPPLSSSPSSPSSSSSLPSSLSSSPSSSSSSSPSSPLSSSTSSSPPQSPSSSPPLSPPPPPPPSSSPSPLSLPVSSSASPSITSSQLKDTFSNDNPTPIHLVSIDSRQEGALLTASRKSFWESKVLARILLLLVPMFWGTYGPAIRFVYEQPYPPSPSVLTLARKALSLFFFFCFLPLEAPTNPLEHSVEELGYQEQDSFKLDKGKFSNMNQLPGFLTDFLGIEWFAAVELGLWTFLGTACQTDGLENTTATRAGFLLQSITVLVPLLSTFSGAKVNPATWSASALAFLGVTYMTVNTEHNSSVSISWTTLLSKTDFSRGDLEILLAAFFYALCTVRLGSYAAKTQAVQLSTNVMVVSAILAASWVLFDHTGALSMDLHSLLSPNIALAIIFSALVPGTLASLGQTIGQRTISAAEAQVYFSLQPFYSAIFAAVILKENIDNATWVAGAVLVVAAFIASFDALAEVKR